MADTVQYLMEQMVPELEDLEKKGYFTRAEIKKLAQKRQNFEYLLKRRTALKEDFYRYIDFESKLEELRKHRKTKLGIKGKKGLAEMGIVRRIHFIYERAGRKFRSDISLWMRWIEDCKRYKSTKQLSKVITKALQRHATVSELWIEAARWEFDTNNDISAARSLMQQGIRMCKADETIWVEYYKLELLYALKLRVRRLVLGLDDPAASAGREQGEASRSAAAARAVMEGGVARIVYKNAVAALPGRLAFRARFLRVLRGFDYGFVQGLMDQVYHSIRQDFDKVEEAWDLLARRHLESPGHRPAGGEAGGPAEATDAMEAEAAEKQLTQHAEASGRQAQPDESADSEAEAWDADAHARVCAVYEEALIGVPSARMHSLYTAYLCGVLDRLMASGEGALQSAVAVAAQLFGLLQRVHAGGGSTPETYITWAEWAEKVQQPKMALKAARKGCERFPADVSMWRRRLALEIASNAASSGGASGRQEPPADLLATFTAALQATQPDQAAEVWLMAVEAVPVASREWGRLAEMLVTACAKVAKKVPSGGLGGVAAAMVSKARTALGVEGARQLYSKLLAVPAPGGDLFRCAIHVEREELGLPATEASSSAAAAQPSKAAAKRVTDLYDKAVSVYGATEVDLWVQYARWMVLCGKASGPIYWRATKELADPDAFVAQFREGL
ncbi:hypothetical protein GPECTOR_38g323 [Gonium pectorale]|uniref:UTP6 protein n=1 Tax=Gonium pectorale TaxID=33097 RepID=A0A150GB71_GONPE|nr:hypothetical protein GPECTOR_38g323 [Gonium pectorale]|eukprot:KXZ47086.1 hypothetical protein GPECTOR_38g323 [Gonium pectorale]